MVAVTPGGPEGACTKLRWDRSEARPSRREGRPPSRSVAFSKGFGEGLRALHLTQSSPPSLRAPRELCAAGEMQGGRPHSPCAGEPLLSSEAWLLLPEARSPRCEPSAPQHSARAPACAPWAPGLSPLSPGWQLEREGRECWFSLHNTNLVWGHSLLQLTPSCVAGGRRGSRGLQMLRAHWAGPSRPFQAFPGCPSFLRGQST